MNWKRIGLALGATAITGAAVYGGNQYFDGSLGGPGGGAGTTLAEPTELQAEAIDTDCGLTNSGDEGTAKAGVVGASVTRARVTVSSEISAGDDVAAGIEAGDCRFRLDGVWIQDVELSLDQEVEIDGYEPGNAATLDQNLLHGTYLTPEILMIEASEDGSELTLRSGTEAGETIIARAADETPMEEVFTTPRGARKAYLVGDETAPNEDSSIFVDVTRTGRVRIRLAGQNFYRPQASAAGNQATAANDPWMIERNLDNLDASLKGYDAYAQDVFRLNQNPKARIFEAADANTYTVQEKRTVPLGLKLVAEGAQGSVTNSTLIRTEREYQKTVRTSLGANVGFEGESAGGGVGASYTESNTSGMREGAANSIAAGFARHKIYALVLDQPFVRLSDEFVDAIEDARRYGRYDELIERFGTHYPYAVTYGSAARMSAEFTEDTVAGWEQSSQDVNANAGIAIGGFGASLSAGRFEETGERNEMLSSSESSSFEAVGGTGSFGQEGHASGTPYPILADLRPLHELLSPLNFPGEPEVYTEVRANLRTAIAAYLAESGQELSDVRPEIERQYVVTPTLIRCERDRNGALPSDNGKVTLTGSIALGHGAGGGQINTRSISHSLPWSSGEFVLNCKSGNRFANFPARRTTITGTRSELAGTRFDWSANVSGTRHVVFAGTNSYANGGLGSFNVPLNLAVGDSWDHKTYVVNQAAYPKIAVVARVERIR
ncbi:MAG: MAC/perforin domain-containing protein [Erythrobacter sp.]